MKNFILAGIIGLLPFVFSMQAQGQDETVKNTVEVYYFHATMRCPTCLAIEEQTKKTLDENFIEEIKSGSVKLIVINLEEKENKELVKKFEVGWSSLFLYVAENNTTVNLTEDAFANARSHPEDFRVELEKEIKELM